MHDGSEKLSDDDTWLMLQSAAGSISAFEKLYRKYLPIAISYLTSLNGYEESLDDLASEVFIRVWRSRQLFRGVSTFKTYLFGVARNVLSEHRKGSIKEGICRRQLSERHRRSSTASSDMTSGDDREKLAKTIKQAISKLSANQRQAIRLFHIEAMTVKEAAEHAKCSVEAFAGRLRRARMQLGRFLANVQQDIDSTSTR
jgi:RNA polymerase sigma-70 factor (ECF subfamily)